MFLLLGIIGLVGAFAAYIFNMHTSYVTQGGRLDQNPCIAAAAIQVPMLTMLGLSLLDKSGVQFDWPWWLWPTVWLVETLFIIWTMIWIGDVAYKKAAMNKACAADG
jgi:hypothetical protein